MESESGVRSLGSPGSGCGGVRCGCGAPVIDPDAFNAFEARGWEDKAAGYDRFFAGITGQFVEPLLDAASVGPGTRMLDLATGPVTWRRERPNEARLWLEWTSRGG